MDFSTDLAGLVNTNFEPQSDLSGDVDEHVNCVGENIDSFFDLACDLDAFQDLQAPYQTDLDVELADQTLNDFFFPNSVQAQHGTALDHLGEFNNQHDLNDWYHPTMMDAPRSQDWNDWLIAEPQYISVEDLVEPGGEDAASSFTNDATKAVNEYASKNTNHEHANFTLEDLQLISASGATECAPNLAEIVIPQHTHDKSQHSAKRRLQSPGQASDMRGKKAARTSISASAKEALLRQFQLKPYLDADITTKLSAQTSLSRKTIGTWFANERSRNKSLSDETPDHKIIATVEGAENRTTSAVSETHISAENLGEVDRASPTHSLASLEKYLSTSVAEEGVSAFAVQASLQNAMVSSPWPKFTTMTSQSPSVVGSDRSIGSAMSSASHASHRSVDHRGPRRGRRTWVTSSNVIEKSRARSTDGYESHPTPNATECRDSSSNPQPTTTSTLIAKRDRLVASFERPVGSLSTIIRARYRAYLTEERVKAKKDTTPQKEGRLFCTWPDCSQSFRYRDAWERHEESVHYCPYQWVCCSNVDYTSSSSALMKCIFCERENATLAHITSHSAFASCVSGLRESRAFMREDHLVQHINRTHGGFQMGKAMLRGLLTEWKVENPRMTWGALCCGFCGEIFSSWSARKNHVFAHYFPADYDSVSKSDWSYNRIGSQEEGRGAKVARQSAEIMAKLEAVKALKADLHEKLRALETTTENLDRLLYAAPTT